MSRLATLFTFLVGAALALPACGSSAQGKVPADHPIYEYHPPEAEDEEEEEEAEEPEEPIDPELEEELENEEDEEVE